MNNDKGTKEVLSSWLTSHLTEKENEETEVPQGSESVQKRNSQSHWV